jgi:hypothetical protein
MRNLEMNNRTEELKDEQLDRVSGGLNPQPLPPGPGDPFVRTLSVFRINPVFRFNAFRFW